MTCHQCSKRLVTKSKEKEIDGSQNSFTAASVIRTSWLGGRLEIFSKCGPSASWCSPIGTTFALCPLAVVVRIPCRIALQRTPAHGTPLGLHRPPAPHPCARKPILPTCGVVLDYYSSRRSFRGRPHTIYWFLNCDAAEEGVKGSEGQHEREEGPCRSWRRGCRYNVFRCRWCCRPLPCPLRPPQQESKNTRREGPRRKRKAR